MQRQHVANGLNCRLFNKAKDPEYTVLIGIVKTGRAQSVSTYETNFLWSCLVIKVKMVPRSAVAACLSALRFRWSPKILSQRPFHTYLYLPMLYESQVRGLGGGLPSKRLGVVLVEVVSKHDCKSSDLVNSNRNVTITLWGRPLRRLPGLAEVKTAWFTCWWMSVMSLDVHIPFLRFKIWGCEVQCGATLDTFS